MIIAILLGSAALCVLLSLLALQRRKSSVLGALLAVGAVLLVTGAGVEAVNSAVDRSIEASHQEQTERDEALTRHLAARYDVQVVGPIKWEDVVLQTPDGTRLLCDLEGDYAAPTAFCDGARTELATIGPDEGSR